MTEGEFSVDVQIGDISESYLFTRGINTNSGVKSAFVENGCLTVGTRDTLTLRRFEEDANTIQLQLNTQP